jgi:hypothetical protein
VNCDAPDPPVYLQAGGTAGLRMVCRCMICPRCGHHTGNSTQGHYWSWCKVTMTMRGHHLCCPGDCALEENDDKPAA